MRAAEPALVWIGALGGAVLWALHLLVSYAIVGVGCKVTSEETVLGAALVGTTAVAAAAIAATLGLAWRPYRQGRSWRRFLGGFGLVFGGLSLAGVLLAAPIPAFLAPCAV
jgi:hypothetical protein